MWQSNRHCEQTEMRGNRNQGKGERISVARRWNRDTRSLGRKIPVELGDGARGGLVWGGEWPQQAIMA